ncbi:deleted in malignant brain tumors 1 protein-like, partial [Chanos chanos]|uniref:Deleted in malignant brain tumors 1 protein-like n=1 Tax=Chanos chanos TaxID=29144 RepID=A0A6J2VTV0_CHACN
LVNGGKRCAGRVEVLHEGQWGTVCSFSWDMTDAAVVCRELDCGEAVAVLHNAHFGEGSGPIWMENVACSGSESTLKNCTSAGWGKHNCLHSEDAGVICSGHVTRLVDGFNLCSGRLELLRGNKWGTVCDAAFDQQDAEVVCRELGCGAPGEILGGAAFGRGEGHVLSDEFQCGGNESEIFLCPKSPSQKQNCSHNNDVGLTCTAYTEFKLVGGPDSCAGRVELRYLDEWGTVCDASWDMRAASVLCRQLNCGSALGVVGLDRFGEGSGQIWSDVFDCQGNETHLSDCVISSWSRASCSHEQDVGVICSDSSKSLQDGMLQTIGERECEGEFEVYYRKAWRRYLLNTYGFPEASVMYRALGMRLMYINADTVLVQTVVIINIHQSSALVRHSDSGPRSLRLVGSGSDCAGRLEIFHKNSWGTVCDDSWDIEDAQVVCRQLQCGEALSAPVPAWFGPGTGPIWLDEVECLGNETSLRRKFQPTKSFDMFSIFSPEAMFRESNDIYRFLTNISCYQMDHNLKDSISSSTSFCSFGSFLGSRNTAPTAGGACALSKRKHMTISEVVYEEINDRFITKRTSNTVQRGGNEEEVTPEDYDDVRSVGDVQQNVQKMEYENVVEETLKGERKLSEDYVNTTEATK